MAKQNVYAYMYTLCLIHAAATAENQYLTTSFALHFTTMQRHL